MILQKKLEHIWEYYRIPILGAVLAIAVVIGICMEWSGRNVPDYEIAVVTRSALMAEETELLTDFFTKAAAELDDGKDNVLLTVYQFDPVPEDGESGAYLDIYNGVTLNAELTSGNSLIFLTDAQGYALLQGQGENFLTNVGEEAYIPLTRLIPALPEALQDLRVCLRSDESVFLESAASARQRFDAHAALIEACIP